MKNENDVVIEQSELEHAFRYACHVLHAKGYADAKEAKPFFSPQGTETTNPNLYRAYKEGFDMGVESLEHKKLRDSGQKAETHA